jgi:hypothetical protein
VDLTLSFKSPVSNICKASYSQLQALKHIRRMLTKDIALSIAVALVQSRLDYANSILYRTSSHSINKLQRVQTTAARLVVVSRQIPDTDLLSHLNGLPVAKRIHFKIATSAYKALSTQKPAYLRSLINYHVPARELRISALHKLHQLAAREIIGQCACSFASPHIYNTLLLSIRSASSLLSFKHQLRTIYFNSSPGNSPTHALHQ